MSETNNVVRSPVIELVGLDGSNPLAFLATLGVLRTLTLENTATAPRLAWDQNFRPVIHVDPAISQFEFLQKLVEGVKAIADSAAVSFGNIIGVDVDVYKHFADPTTADPRKSMDSARMAFAAALASDAVVDSKKATVIPTALSFSNGQGGKLLLKDFRTLAGRLDAERLSAALFAPWVYDDTDQPTFRWDPLDMRTGAHMATDPGSTETRSVMAANAMAVVGLSLLPVFATQNGLRSTGIVRVDGEWCFTWPLWDYPVPTDVVISLLQQKVWPSETGIIARFGARRIMFKKNLYLGGSFAF